MQPHDVTGISTEYLIARSGIIGRQILRLYQIIHRNSASHEVDATASDRAVSQQSIPRWLTLNVIRRLIDVAYTYYIGGSLTRSDQMTFARLHGMHVDAYRLTLFNALFCGIPCAIGYFLLGEGFTILKSIHSYTELPSLLAHHTSLTIGAISLAVDIFRAIDAAWHRRCWAPFGFFPMAVNLPTYLKHWVQRGMASPPAAHHRTTPSR